MKILISILTFLMIFTSCVRKESSTTINKFKIGDQVCILNKMSGVIIEVLPIINENFISYKIDYVSNQKIETKYFYEFELKAGSCSN